MIPVQAEAGQQERSAAVRIGRTIASLLRHATLIVAAGYLGLYGSLAALRLGYPFELEWMEGGAVDHVRRILAGLPLYTAPSLEFTPYLYPPFYFQVSAAVSRLIGIGFLPLRLVSILSSLGVLLLIGLLVRKDTDDRFAAILAAGLFAACYRVGGAWLDMGRPDSLGLMLVLLAIYLLRSRPETWAWILAGLIVSMAVLTKQSALTVALGVGIYGLVHAPRKASCFIAVVALLVGGSTLAFDRLSAGWYSYYVWELPRDHPIVVPRLLLFWRDDLLAHLPFACALGLAFLWFAREERVAGARSFQAAVAAGLISASWLVRVRTGSYDNVLLPALAGIAVLFGLGVHEALRLCRLESGGERAEAFLYSVCLLQFCLLLYDPRSQVPTRADEAAGRKLLAAVQGFPGEVYLPSHGYLPAMAGKRTWAQEVAVLDVMRSRRQDVAARLRAEISQAVEKHVFDAVILDNRAPRFLVLEGRYERKGPVFDDGDVFWPVTGFKTRPSEVLIPTARSEAAVR